MLQYVGFKTSNAWLLKTKIIKAITNEPKQKFTRTHQLTGIFLPNTNIKVDYRFLIQNYYEKFRSLSLDIKSNSKSMVHYKNTKNFAYLHRQDTGILASYLLRRQKKTKHSNSTYCVCKQNAQTYILLPVRTLYVFVFCRLSVVNAACSCMKEEKKKRAKYISNTALNDIHTAHLCLIGMDVKWLVASLYFHYCRLPRICVKFIRDTDKNK